jgi:hypothetical protein
VTLAVQAVLAVVVAVQVPIVQEAQEIPHPQVQVKVALVELVLM